MATIGTTGRDYSTITLWNAALGSGSQTGECYADSDFEEGATVTINDADPSDITLTAAAGEEHDGTTNTGVRLLQDFNGPALDVRANIPLIIEKLEIDLGQTYYTGDSGAIYCFGSTVADRHEIRNNLIHGGSSAGDVSNGIHNYARQANIHDNIIYDMRTSAITGDPQVGIYANDDKSKVYNNTVHDLDRSGATTNGESYGIACAYDDANTYCKNNCVTDITHTGGGGGDRANFKFLAGITNINADYNLSDDDTADDGGGSNDVVSAATDQYLNITPGSENLHLDTGVAALDAGVGPSSDSNVSTTDIDGDSRSGATCDIGADEYVAAGGNAMPMAIHHYTMAGGL